MAGLFKCGDSCVLCFVGLGSETEIGEDAIVAVFVGVAEPVGVGVAVGGKSPKTFNEAVLPT